MDESKFYTQRVSTRTVDQTEVQGSMAKIDNLHLIRNKIYFGLKRAGDIALSIAGLVVASPILLLTAVLIKLESKGPVLYNSTRVGQNNKHFCMYKFRSMTQDADKKLHELMKFNEVDGPAFKMECDPRVTKVGKFIRKYSIDELPQLVNVLLGDMSLVGPRPPLPHEVEKYQPSHRRRLVLKPGLTCFWQVCGRSNVGFEEWMKMDIEYIEQMGLWTDFKILIKTVPAVLFGKGAY